MSDSNLTANEIPPLERARVLVGQMRKHECFMQIMPTPYNPNLLAVQIMGPQSAHPGDDATPGASDARL